MHRFYLPDAPTGMPTRRLTGSEAHHAIRVLRVRKGDEVIVLDGRGGEEHCNVVSADRDTLELATISARSFPRPAPPIALFQALPKGKILEAIIQKATELGTSRIVPVLTERVVIHVETDREPTKLARWVGTAVEAIKQCGTPWLPAIEPPARLLEILKRPDPPEVQFVASLEPNGKHLGAAFDKFHAAHGRLPTSIGAWVGPEGDFSGAELAALRRAGATPITLGDHVLRVETAAVCVLSILNHEVTRAR